MKRTITLSVPLVEDSQAPTVFEVLARACAGLLLDGIAGSIYSYDDDEGSS